MDHCEIVLNCHFWFVCYLSETFMLEFAVYVKHSKVASFKDNKEILRLKHFLHFRLNNKIIFDIFFCKYHV